MQDRHQGELERLRKTERRRSRDCLFWLELSESTHHPLTAVIEVETRNQTN